MKTDFFMDDTPCSCYNNCIIIESQNFGGPKFEIAEAKKRMELNYTYWKDNGWYVGHLDDYPDYNTQGETLEEFEEMLRSLYEDIKTCDFSFVRHHGKLRIA